MNATKLPNKRPRGSPSHPLTRRQQKLAEENYALVHWVKSGILRRRKEYVHTADELTAYLEDAYLAAVRGFDRKQGVKFATYAVASMKLSGYRNWMRWLIETYECTTCSLDYREQHTEHGEPVLWWALAVESDPTAGLCWDELLARITSILGPTNAALFVEHYANGVDLAELGRREGCCRENIRQIMARLTNKLRMEFRVTRPCAKCGYLIPTKLAKCPCRRTPKRDRSKRGTGEKVLKNPEATARIDEYSERARLGVDLFGEVPPVTAATVAASVKGTI